MNKRNIFILIIIALVIMVAFWYLKGSNSSSSSSLTATQSSSDSADAQYIYSLLQQMSQVKLDDSIFSDPSFENLKDNTVTFSSEPSGRNNPFAPVGSNGTPSTSTINVSIN